MDPAQLVADLVRDIALQGSHGATVSQIWEFVSPNLNTELDTFTRKAIWHWLLADSRVEVLQHEGAISPSDHLELPQDPEVLDSVLFIAIEDHQWLALTGRPRESNPVGPRAMELLCAVSRARAAGISSVELSKETGQDARSLYGRVMQLVELGLVTRYPIVQSKAHTNLIVFHRYVDQYKKSSQTASSMDHINKHELLKSVVEWCKSGPSQMRLRQDLYYQLKFDKVKNGARLFRNLLIQGEKLGYIKLVHVHEPDKPNELYRCVKYLRDLGDSGASAIEDTNDFDDEEEDGETVEFEAQESNVNMSRLVLAAAEPDSKLPLVNMYYPLEHQVYDFVLNKGTAGCSAMSLYKELTGTPFSKPLGRLLDMMIPVTGKANKIPKHLEYLTLFRGLDFVSRSKFYRYFTKVTYEQAQGNPIAAAWGTIPQQPKGASSLRALNNGLPPALAGYSAIARRDTGELRAIFRGDKLHPKEELLLSYDTGAKRGRPRKNAVPEESKAIGSNPPTRPEIPVADRQWQGGSSRPVKRAPVYFLQDIKEEVSSLQSGSELLSSQSSVSTPVHRKAPISLALAKRRSDILHVLRQNDGVCEGGLVLNRLLNDQQSDGSTIDRKTMASTVSSLVVDGQVAQMYVTAPSKGISVTKYLLYDVTLEPTDPKVQALKDKIANSIRNPVVPAARRQAAASIVELDITELAESSIAFARMKSLAETRLAKKDKPPAGRGRPAALAAASRSSQQAKTGSAVKAVPASRGSRGRDATGQTRQSTPRKRKREPVSDEATTSAPQTPVDAEKLYRAVIIARSLYSKGSNIEWALVSRALPETTVTAVRKRWPSVREQYGGTKALAKATDQWETVFLAAYEKRELTYQDPEDESFSLQPYIDYWAEHQSTTLLQNNASLSSRAEFEAMYGKIKAAPRAIPLDGLFNLPSMVRAEELMAKSPFTVDVKRAVPDNWENWTQDELAVRAVVAAGIAGKEKEAAEDLLEIGEARVKAATDSLVSRKVIHFVPSEAAKVGPGGNFQLSERVLATLLAKQEHEILSAAQQSYNSIPQSFEVPATVEDSSMVTILELIANKGAQLVRDNAMMGRLITDYRSRMIEKDKLECEVTVQIKKRDVVVRTQTKPHVSQDSLYLWHTKHGVNLPLFQMLVSRVLMLIVSHPHIPTDILFAHLHAALNLREVQAILTWLLDTNRITQSDGFVANKFWFL